MSAPIEIRHFHMFGAIGGGAKGFNKARPRAGGLVGKMRCIGSVDVDAAACRDFRNMVGVGATVLDLFDREQYIAFHGNEPPADWREATPQDIQRAAGGERPHIVFLSAPCKGFSGLLSETKSKTAKYQALNRLTLRGVWLMLEAWADDPPELVLFENVPRLATRGRALLDQITSMLRAYGYATAETTHDCGEIGGLAQSRKRFLLVARHLEKVPPFLYEPAKRPLRAVGEVLGRMALPGDLRAGPMHRVPNLQWKTWVRLAFVEAGSDWRSLNKLTVEDGVLRDYLVVPDMHHGGYGVQRWGEPSVVVRGASRPANGYFAVADPRYEAAMRNGPLGVVPFHAPAGTVAGENRATNGPFNVADPRFDPRGNDFAQYGVRRWDEPMGAVINVKAPGQGSYTVADPRHDGPAKHSNEFRVVPWSGHSMAVTSAHGTGQGVADPRPGWDRHGNNLSVMDWEKPAHTVIAGGKGVQGGWMSVADPRPKPGPLFSKYPVTAWDARAGTVIGGDDTGAYAVADPRSGLNRSKGDHYLSGGHYGVLPWTEPAGTVSSSASYDNGPWSIADPRAERAMPAADHKMVARIRALDGTWHRPFTTLELAALQSLIEPEEWFELDGLSDSAWRERIGNAVPSEAACAIGEVMGQTLLLAWSGETFTLSAMPIWVRDVAVALAIRGVA